MNAIPHSKPWITNADTHAVENVLCDGMLAQGELSARLERALANWVGAHGAVAVGSGSAAIFLALKAFGIGPGDEVILPTYVCVSVLEAVISVGAKPVLTDVGHNWVITRSDVEQHFNVRTRAVIVPHMYGFFADVASFRKFGVPLIEDCAQALDRDRARQIEGDVAIFSFHPTKCLTTGEGGMAASQSRQLIDSMRAFRDGGTHARAGRVFSPLSNMAAALGLSQLSRYDEMIERRRKMAEGYRNALGVVIPKALPDARLHTMHFRFPLKLEGGADAYHKRFLEQGIHIRRGVDDLLHRFLAMEDGDYPRAVELYNTTVSIPIYPALTENEYRHCVNVATEIFRNG